MFKNKLPTLTKLAGPTRQIQWKFRIRPLRSYPRIFYATSAFDYSYDLVSGLIIWESNIAVAVRDCIIKHCKTQRGVYLYTILSSPGNRLTTAAYSSTWLLKVVLTAAISSTERPTRTSLSNPDGLAPVREVEFASKKRKKTSRRKKFQRQWHNFKGL